MENNNFTALLYSFWEKLHGINAVLVKDDQNRDCMYIYTDTVLHELPLLHGQENQPASQSRGFWTQPFARIPS